MQCPLISWRSQRIDKWGYILFSQHMTELRIGEWWSMLIQLLANWLLDPCVFQKQVEQRMADEHWNGKTIPLSRHC